MSELSEATDGTNCADYACKDDQDCDYRCDFCDDMTCDMHPQYTEW